MENQFSFKELYDVKLKATYNREINGRHYEEGEVICCFDKIQIASLDEMKKVVTANGGFDNRARVYWESTKEVQIRFTQGIFSSFELGLITNGKVKSKTGGDPIILSQREYLETDENGEVVLKRPPQGKIFVYDKETGESLSFEQEGQKLKFTNSYKEIVIDYNFEYLNNSNTVQYGEEFLKGTVELEGRTKAKDDVTGLVRTGIVKIPKLKLMSSLSIRLGDDASPVVGVFNGSALPVGVKGNTKVVEITFLDQDLDSDF